MLAERCAPAALRGIDPSAEQIAFARAQPALAAARFDVGDAMALPYADDAFDAAVMALVIFFVPEPARSIAEMARVVRPGGGVSTYAWDILGGGFPYATLQEEMAALGPPPLWPPSAEASRMDGLACALDRSRARAGRDARDHGRTELRRLRLVLGHRADRAAPPAATGRDGARRRAAAEATGCVPG